MRPGRAAILYRLATAAPWSYKAANASQAYSRLLQSPVIVDLGRYTLTATRAMISFTLSRRERVMVTGLGLVFLIPGLAILALARPLPVLLTCFLVVVGVMLTLIGAVGRFPNTPQPSAEIESIAEPDQTLTHVSIGGARHARIRCGCETELGGEVEFCSDCFARAGQFHALGCDLEECPKCHRQMISCGCGIDECKRSK